MSATNIISLLGGVAMFLFGMSVMGDSLKKVAGSKMEMILYKLAGNTAKGIMLGTGVTAVIQSSSATSVMVVGFVNSGMMKVKQAIGIILGAVLGTSITGWILCLNSLGGSGASVAKYFSTEILTGVVALAGIIMWMFAKKNSIKNIGGIMLGFAVLMYGMSMMSGSISPLRSDPHFIKERKRFGRYSAGARDDRRCRVQHGIPDPHGYRYRRGGSRYAQCARCQRQRQAHCLCLSGHRCARCDHLRCRLLCAQCDIPFPLYDQDDDNGLDRPRQHLVQTGLTPLIGVMDKIVRALFPEGEEAAAEQADMDRLESRFLDHPTLALAQTKTVIDSMAEKALKSVKYAVSLRQEYSKEKYKKVMDLEGVLDRYEDKIGQYLFTINTQDINQEQANEVSKYLSVLSDFERMSDHARNIGEAVQEITDKKIILSEGAQKELKVLEKAVTDISEMAIKAFIENDNFVAFQIDPLEEVIDDLCDRIKNHHIERVSRKECSLETGFVFNDLLTDYERISDHCSNIAVDVIESEQGLFGQHQYHQILNEAQDEAFHTYFDDFKKEYSLD